MLQLKNAGFDGAAGSKTVHVLTRVNLTLPARGRVLVTGPSGSGKTALLRLISGREQPSRGEILLDGESTHRWNDARRSAWRRRVAAASEDLLLPDRTLLQNAELSLRLAGWRGREMRQKAQEALAALGLGNSYYRRAAVSAKAASRGQSPAAVSTVISHNIPPP